MAHTLVRDIDHMASVTNLQISECEREFQQVSGKNFISVYTFSFLIYLCIYKYTVSTFVKLCKLEKKLVHIITFRDRYFLIFDTIKLNLHST